MRKLRKVKTGWCNGFGGMGRCRSVIFALILLIPLTVMFESAVLAAPRPVRNVVWEGDTAPGTGGATFTEFDEPFVNTRWLCAIRCTLYIRVGTVSWMSEPPRLGKYSHTDRGVGSKTSLESAQSR